MYYEQSGILDEIPEGHVLSDMFRRNTGYAVHHIVSQTYTPLYTNTTPEKVSNYKRYYIQETIIKIYLLQDYSHDGVTGGLKEYIHGLKTQGYAMVNRSTAAPVGIEWKALQLTVWLKPS